MGLRSAVGLYAVLWLLGVGCSPFPELPPDQQPPEDFPCDYEGRCPGTMTCDATTNTCVGGSSANCVAPLSDCGGTCTYLLADPDHCGRCDNTCGDGQSCIQGTCSGTSTDCLACAPGVACVAGACSCEGRGTLCTALCLDTAQLSVSCGACFQSCASDEICRNSTCQCPPGQQRCGQCNRQQGPVL